LDWIKAPDEKAFIREFGIEFLVFIEFPQQTTILRQAENRASDAARALRIEHRPGV
jgi:hypothetical protein